jgi:hypothetical protein
MPSLYLIHRWTIGSRSAEAGIAMSEEVAIKAAKMQTLI